MERLHKIATLCLDGLDTSKLVQTLQEIEEQELDSCQRGYYHLYQADLLGNSLHYQDAFKWWGAHLQGINEREKSLLLRLSDNCWWNMQLGDIATHAGENSYPYYAKSFKAGEELLPLMESKEDYKGILTHELFLGYITVKSSSPKKFKLPSQFIENMKKKIEMYPDIKSSLINEAQGLIAILSNDENIKVTENLMLAFKSHVLYLHKKRCKNILEYWSRHYENRLPAMAGR